MTVAPDGRVFVGTQSGQIHIIENDQMLAQPFLDIPVDDFFERGLLGIAFDPDFAHNQRVYVYYTTPDSPTHNRVSRFTANGNSTVPNSEQVIVDLNNLSAGNHNITIGAYNNDATGADEWVEVFFDDVTVAQPTFNTMTVDVNGAPTAVDDGYAVDEGGARSGLTKGSRNNTRQNRCENQEISRNAPLALTKPAEVPYCGAWPRRTLTCSKR